MTDHDRSCDVPDFKATLANALWIGPSLIGTGTHGAPAAMLRRRFVLERPPASAWLSITALGVYEPWLNGRRIGCDELAPGWTDYRFRLAVQRYDVSALVREGENVLGTWLGDGWSCGRIGQFDRGMFYEKRPALRAALEVIDEDARVRRWMTDESWQ